MERDAFSIRSLTIGFLLLLLGCGPSGPAKRSDRVFRVAMDVPLMSLDPALVSDSYSIDAIQNSFEGLVAMGEDNRIHPCLAESWDLSKDGKTFTFHLRKSVKFHNGKTLQSTDVKRSLERACLKVLASPLAFDYLNDIVGARPLHEGVATEMSGIKVIDPNTVSITLDAPRPYFLAKLTCPVATVVDCDALKDKLHVATVAEMVGTGPFRVESYSEGQMLVQRAFPGYWGEKAKVDRIERPIMRDAVDRLNAFRRGEIDMVPQLARSDYGMLLSDPQFKDQVKLLDRATLNYFALNVEQWPDIRVRRAIAMAIDRERIANDTLLGTVTPAKGVLPPGIPGYRADAKWIAPDADKARALLAEAGHPNGKGLPALRISFPMENPDVGRIADQIGSQLHDTLGITVVLDKMETATLVQKQDRRELACVESGWFADYLDPQDFISMLLVSSATENHWNYKNPRFDALCAEADVCVDPKRRLDLYAQAEDLALQDAVMVPICYWKTPSAMSRRVHGVRSYAAEYLPFNSVWMGG